MVLSMMDHRAGFTLQTPIPNNAAGIAARTINDRIIGIFGPPEKLQSDRGPELENMVISLLQNSDTRKPGRYPIDPRETLYLNEYIQRVNYKNMRTPDLPTCPTQASVYIAVYMCRVFFFLWFVCCPPI